MSQRGYWPSLFSYEEVVKPPEQQKLGWRDSMQAVFSNGPLMVVIGLFTLGMLGFTVRQTVTIYYFTYNVGQPDLIGLFFGLGLVVMFAGLPFVPALAARFGKGRRHTGGCSFHHRFLCRFLSDAGQRACMDYFLGLSGCLGRCPVAVLGWAMIPDTVEYAQWKHGKRADGAVYASASFFQKLGKAVGGAGVALALSAVGYVANQEQTPETLEAIKQMLTFVPIVLDESGHRACPLLYSRQRAAHSDSQRTGSYYLGSDGLERGRKLLAPAVIERHKLASSISSAMSRVKCQSVRMNGPSRSSLNCPAQLVIEP